MDHLSLLTILISILSTQACSPRPFQFPATSGKIRAIEYLKSSVDETEEKPIVDCVKEKLNSIDNQVNPEANGTQILFLALFLQNACELKEVYENKFESEIDRPFENHSIEFLSNELAFLSANFTILEDLKGIQNPQRNFTNQTILREESEALINEFKSCSKELNFFFLLDDLEYLTSYLFIKQANETEIELTKEEFVKVYPAISLNLFECAVNDLKLQEMSKSVNELPKGVIKNVAEYIESSSPSNSFTLSSSESVPLIRTINFALDSADDDSDENDPSVDILKFVNRNCVNEKFPTEKEFEVKENEATFALASLCLLCVPAEYHDKIFDYDAKKKINSGLSLECVGLKLQPLASHFSILQNLNSTKTRGECERELFEDEIKMSQNPDDLEFELCEVEFTKFSKLEHYLHKYLQDKPASEMEYQKAKEEFKIYIRNVAKNAIECVLEKLKLRE